MIHIQEVSVSELNDVVQFVHENWNELSKRPKASCEERELAYWKALQGQQRILVYRLEDKTISGLLTLSKEGDVTHLDHFLVKVGMRRQGMGTKMLKIAERMAGIWKTKYIDLLGNEENELVLSYFQRLGFILQCPIQSKQHILIEKKL